LRDIEALLDDALDGHLIHRRPETYEIAAHLRRALISTDAPVHMTPTAAATAHASDLPREVNHMLFWTADTHFGHANIIRLCNRPYDSVEEMDESLIVNWNTSVGPDDDVYHLGDFAFRGDPNRTRDIFARLNGRKRLIIGNHDNETTLALPWFEPPTHYSELQVDKKTRLVMCHYAMRVWNGSHRGSLHLFGHSHGSLPGTRTSIDVGVDSVGLFPVSLETIRHRMRYLPEVDPATGLPVCAVSPRDTTTDQIACLGHGV